MSDHDNSSSDSENDYEEEDIAFESLGRKRSLSNKRIQGSALTHFASYLKCRELRSKPYYNKAPNDLVLEDVEDDDLVGNFADYMARAVRTVGTANNYISAIKQWILGKFKLCSVFDDKLWYKHLRINMKAKFIAAAKEGHKKRLLVGSTIDDEEDDGLVDSTRLVESTTTRTVGSKRKRPKEKAKCLPVNSIYQHMELKKRAHELYMAENRRTNLKLDAVASSQHMMGQQLCVLQDAISRMMAALTLPGVHASLSTVAVESTMTSVPKSTSSVVESTTTLGNSTMSQFGAAPTSVVSRTVLQFGGNDALPYVHPLLIAEKLPDLTLAEVFIAWYEYSIYTTDVTTLRHYYKSAATQIKQRLIRFARTVAYMKFFLPTDTVIELKPPDEDTAGRENWAVGLARLATQAETAIVNFRKTSLLSSTNTHKGKNGPTNSFRGCHDYLYSIDVNLLPTLYCTHVVDFTSSPYHYDHVMFSK